MSIKAAIKAKIESVSAVSAAGMTVFYGVAPQRRALPYVIMNRIGGGEYGADMGGRQGWNKETFQIDLYHENDAALETIRNAVIDAVHARGPVVWSGITVLCALVTDTNDLTELETDGTETGICRQMISLQVKYEP